MRVNLDMAPSCKTCLFSQVVAKLDTFVYQYGSSPGPARIDTLVCRYNPCSDHTATIVKPDGWCGKYIRREDGKPWIESDTAALPASRPDQVPMHTIQPLMISGKELGELRKTYREKYLSPERDECPGGSEG